MSDSRNILGFDGDALCAAEAPVAGQFAFYFSGFFFFRFPEEVSAVV